MALESFKNTAEDVERPSLGLEASGNNCLELSQAQTCMSL